MNTYFYDEDKLADQFCKIEKCFECRGTDFNGEPNGCGCSHRDDYLENNRGLLIENALEDEFYLKSEVDCEIKKAESQLSSYKAEIEARGGMITALERDNQMQSDHINNLDSAILNLQKDKAELIEAYKNDTKRNLDYIRQLMNTLDPIWQEVESKLTAYKNTLNITNKSIEELLNE